MSAHWVGSAKPGHAGGIIAGLEVIEPGFTVPFFAGEVNPVYTSRFTIRRDAILAVAKRQTRAGLQHVTVDARTRSQCAQPILRRKVRGVVVVETQVASAKIDVA